MSKFKEYFFDQAIQSMHALSNQGLDNVVECLITLRNEGGRLFIGGVGGSAGNAVHAAADFRKLAGIESYALLENLSELTAVTNDLGWNEVLKFALSSNKFCAADVLLIFSVGGGSEERQLSVGIIEAIRYAMSCGGKVISFVGKNDGYAAQHSDIVVIGSAPDSSLVTPISESLQGFFWHFLVSHPDIAVQKPVW